MCIYHAGTEVTHKKSGKHRNKLAPCRPESRNGQDDLQVKEHFTKGSCLLNDHPQEGIWKGFLSNTQKPFNPGEWLPSDSPGGVTGHCYNPPQACVPWITVSALSPSARCSQPSLSGPQANLRIDSKLPDMAVHTPLSPVTQVWTRVILLSKWCAY